MYLNFEIRKHLWNAIVPLECGGEHATAFFISEDTLMTVRHAIIEHIYNESTPVFIYFGKKVLCTVEPLGDIDVVLLKCTEHVQHDTLTLLAAEFNEDLELKVLGYPSELGNNRDLISLSIRNRQIVEKTNYDILVIREDALALYNYKGFSGAPVVNELGSVIGIMAQKVSHTLGYISIKQLTKQSWLNDKNIPYKNDYSSEDMSTYGRGKSQRQVANAIKLAGNRYNPKLHQDNSSISGQLNNFINTKEYTSLIKKYNYLKDWFTSSKRSFYTETLPIIKLYKNKDEYGDLWPFFDLAENSDKYDEKKFYEEYLPIYQNLNDQLCDYYKKVIILRGNAGCGKTHFLCHEAEKLSDQINVYLLFGSQFTPSKGIVDQICDLLQFERNGLFLLDDKMKQNNSDALLIIDALNEGADDIYWKQQLLVLYRTLKKFNNIKLILSVRSQSDDYLYSIFAKEADVQQISIDGFSNVDKAVEDYFNEYKVYDPKSSIRSKFIHDFKNPLFLNIFCQAARTFGVDEVLKVPRSVLYEYYVSEKNAEICRKVDEDEYRNITLKYLMSLAKYSLNYEHCLPVPHEKAREYADRICRNRAWSNNLLNVCLKENVLLPVWDRDNKKRVKFEYDQLGDFLRVRAFIDGKRSEQSMRSFLLEEHKKHNSHYLEHFMSALLSEWKFSDKLLEDKIFTDTFQNELLESIKLQNINKERVKNWSFTNHNYEPHIIIDLLSSLSIADVNELNHHMLTMTMYERDMKWSVHIGSLYKTFYEEDFRTRINFECRTSEDAYKACILLLWMCTTPHPQIRYIILRKLVSIFKDFGDDELIISLIESLHTCNDPYLLHILYASVYGYSLLSRNKVLIAKIADKIKQCHYSDRSHCPVDIVVRHWTLSLFAFSKELGNKDLLSQLLPPYQSQNPYGLIIDNFDAIKKDYFGKSIPSQLLYESINGFADFNRYVIGTNSHVTSTIYMQEKDQKFSFVPLTDIILMINNIVKHEYNWTDEIGTIFKDSYSTNRSKNKTERIGKKYQWLALYKVEAMLSDCCKMYDGDCSWNSPILHEKFHVVPYPWYSRVIPNIDPSLTDEVIKEMEPQEKCLFDMREDLSDDEWMERCQSIPQPIFTLTDDQKGKWIVFNYYDSYNKVVKQLNRDLFMFVNSVFIQKDELEKFVYWAKGQNFYGRWMPESRGCYEFLWNEYMWSDRYRQIERYESENRPNGCPCKIILSYQGQLQEDYDGLRSSDNFLSTVYAPNKEMMNKLKLYTAERGVVREKSTGKIVARNFRNGEFHGLAMKKDIFDEYLRVNNLILVYYISGEKSLSQKTSFMSMENFDLSGSYYYDGSNIEPIQPIRIAEDSNQKIVRWKREKEEAEKDDSFFDYD